MTIFKFPISDCDFGSSNLNKSIDSQLEAKLKPIIAKAQLNHEKFIDKYFGPSDIDEFGSNSLYSKTPPSSKYPPPNSLKWVRPIYDDGLFEEIVDDKNDDDDDDDSSLVKDMTHSSSSDDPSECFCEHGKLFIDGSSSGDVIQGQLGDCWFLGALGVLATHEELVRQCFWRLDSFHSFGLFVCRFFKEDSIVFVVIDDRLPVRSRDSKPVFSHCADPNELWVPLLEKAYAKLHGSYSALIGGYSHYALGDLTGYAPQSLVLQRGLVGFTEEYTPEEIWKILNQYKQWGCLMGCSIQPPTSQAGRAEAEADGGLFSGHAYSLLDVGEINLDDSSSLQLLKLRNPWGRGEWNGKFSDRSEEREKYDIEIKRIFQPSDEQGHEVVEIDASDGCFFMTLTDWLDRFTSIFVGLKLPPSWSAKRCKGEWKAQSGGNREMATWSLNPRVRLRLTPKMGSIGEEYKQVFVGLYIHDTRLTMGADYYKDPLFATPLTFDIVTTTEIVAEAKEREYVPFSSKTGYLDNDQLVKQVAYSFGTTQLELFLKAGKEYFIIPSLYRRTEAGTYFITVYADSSFELSQSTEILATSSSSLLNSNNEAILAEKKESLREFLSSELRRLKISLSTIQEIFGSSSSLDPSSFKTRLRDLGMSIADMPDEDLLLLDEDDSGTISATELLSFIKIGLSFFEENEKLKPPPPPDDDIELKPNNLSGNICLSFIDGRDIILPLKNGPTDVRRAILYDSDEARIFYQRRAAGKVDSDASLGFKSNVVSTLQPFEINDSNQSIDLLFSGSSFDSKLIRREGKKTSETRSIIQYPSILKWFASKSSLGVMNNSNTGMRLPDFSISSEAVANNMEDDMVKFDSKKDFWDEIIDSVITVTSSRSKSLVDPVLQIAKKKDVVENLDTNTFSQLTPRLSARSRGNPSIPRLTIRQSVATTVSNDGINFCSSSTGTYENVYRRVLSIPVSSSDDIENSVKPLNSTTKDFMDGLRVKLDRNKDGSVSIDELKLYFKNMQIPLSDEEVFTLLLRACVIESDCGQLDWSHFSILVTSISSFDSETSLCDKIDNIRKALVIACRKNSDASNMLRDSFAKSNLNAQKALQVLGIKLSTAQVSRLQKILDGVMDVLYDESISLNENTLQNLFIKFLMQKIGESSESSILEVSHNGVLKTWEALGGSPYSKLSQDKLVNFLIDLLTGTSTDNIVPFNGLQAKLLAQIASDSLMTSIWNRLEKGSSTGISFTTFEIFFRPCFQIGIENKLKTMTLIEKDYLSPETIVLVNVFLPLSRSHILINSYDPIAGITSSITITELNSLPSKNQIINCFSKHQTYVDTISKFPKDLRDRAYNVCSTKLYNSFDCPYEDQAISRLLQRIRILRNIENGQKLILTEDVTYLSELRQYLERAATDFPFFWNLNEYALKLESENAKTVLDLINLVFNSFRQKPDLTNFLTRSTSSLQLVLSSNNGSLRCQLSWSEMQYHLQHLCNPYITAEILPKPMSTCQYLFDPLVNSVLSTTTSVSNVNQTAPCYDGASHPSWNTKLLLDFQSSLITSCRVLTTEVAKMVIENILKYVIVIVREYIQSDIGYKGSFRFLTVYEPRTATEYQCGVVRPHPLADSLYNQRPEKLNVDINILKQQLTSAADLGVLIPGEAITPRILISVLNKGIKIDTLLGQAEVSISSLLSGSGTTPEQWITMKCPTKTTEKNANSSSEFAGQIKVLMTFRPNVELLAEKESYLARKNRGKIAWEDSSLMNTKNPESIIVQKSFNQTTECSYNNTLKINQISNCEETSINQVISTMSKEKDVSEIIVDSDEPVSFDLKQIKDPALDEEHDYVTSNQNEDKLKGVDPQKHEALLIDYKALLSESERLRKAFNANANRTATQELQSDMKKVSGYGILLGCDTDVFPTRLVELITARYKIRFKKEITSISQPFETLDRVLRTYSRGPDGNITRSDFKDALADISIDTTPEQITALVEQLPDYDIHQGSSVSVESIITFLKSKLAHSNKKLRSRDSAREDINVKSSSKKILRPVQNVTQGLEYEKLKTTQSEKNLSEPIIKTTVTNSASMNTLSPYSKPLQVEKKTKRGSSSNTVNKDVRTRVSSDPETELEIDESVVMSAVDWTTAPLPHNWERKLDPQTNRVYYVDHTNRSTQWRHPLDPSTKQKKLNMIA